MSEDGNSYGSELRELSLAAEKGDTEAGEKLLKLFASLVNFPEQAHPELVRHLAKCVVRFRNLDSVQRRTDSPRAFCVQKPKHRPPNLKPSENHIRAWCAFLYARAEGKSFEEAKSLGAAAGNISEESMHDLARSTKRTKQALNEEMSALFQLTSEQRKLLPE